MGWTDVPVGAFTSGVLDVLGFGSASSFYAEEAFAFQPYNTPASNWYKALPYGFKFTTRYGKSYMFYLPINPENIRITTHWGTNVVPTLYGTIEEHTEQRYFDIILSGTTGFAPRHVASFEAGGASEKTPGRLSYANDTSGVGIDPGAAGGFFQKTIGAINQTLETVNSMAENFKGVQVQSGINPNTSGYLAFHNFYRFLLAYKSDAAGVGNSRVSRKKHPLNFVNYKDNQIYDCAVLRFDLTRDAADPMLYKYQIVLRGYNLRAPQDGAPDAKLQDRLADLGLDGVGGSLFQKMKQTSNGAKGVLGAVQGGTNIFGG